MCAEVARIATELKNNIVVPRIGKEQDDGSNQGLGQPSGKSHKDAQQGKLHKDAQTGKLHKDAQTEKLHKDAQSESMNDAQTKAWIGGELLDTITHETDTNRIG